MEVLTGGGVFWRHSSKYTILASSLTYSTSYKETVFIYSASFLLLEFTLNCERGDGGHTWMTSKLAAPALPTLMVIGLTSALLAKFWIFLGIVAL